MIELTQRDHNTINALEYDRHRIILTDLIAEGFVLNYAESLEKDKFWLIMEAMSEMAAIEIISDLPILSRYRAKVIPLYTNVSNLSHGTVYSLN